jgi:hypothetical protein
MSRSQKEVKERQRVRLNCKRAEPRRAGMPRPRSSDPNSSGTTRERRERQRATGIRAATR